MNDIDRYNELLVRYAELRASYSLLASDLEMFLANAPLTKPSIFNIIFNYNKAKRFWSIAETHRIFKNYLASK